MTSATPKLYLLGLNDLRRCEMSDLVPEGSIIDDFLFEMEYDRKEEEQ